MVQHYTDLLTWQKAVDLAEIIYKITQDYPKEQNYVLVSQMQRSAFSVPSNIAEGRNRHSINDFIYHLNIARGSLAELETQVIISEKISLIHSQQKTDVLNLTTEISRMIYGLRQSLKQKQNGFQEDTLEWLKPLPQTSSL